MVFFYPQHDNRQHKLEDKREDNSNIFYSYDVIKIWEMEKDYVINNKLIGLYSLLPLMKTKEDETPDNIIDELNSIESIMTLNQLFTKSIKVASLDEFSKLLKVITHSFKY